MKSEFKTQNGTGIIELIGDLHVVSVDELRQKFTDWSQNHGGLKYVIVDLQQTTAIDSAGLGLLIAMYKQIQAQGGELVLCSMNKKVRMVFQLTRVHQIFSIYDDLDEALRNCA
ncbi:STAS domain-containing protein [Kiritimatiellaeota bacterium B1221]|nr:STAS domain-containing protein [Kiritimatiellaeota bacterium B1221]